MSLAVVGTDTEIGKTIACAVLAHRYMKQSRLAYWKPVATGSQQETDSSVMKRLAPQGLQVLPESYIFEPPVSPHLAAQLAHQTIERDKILGDLLEHGRRDGVSTLIVEGIGGLLVPLTSGGYLLADLLKELDLPILLVASSRLGTINHTLLTIESMRARRLELVGVALNGPRNRDNHNAIHKFGRVPILGEIEPMDPLLPESLVRESRRFDRGAVLKPFLAEKT